MKHLWLEVGLQYEADYIEKIKNYFAKIGKCRDIYLVDMKQIIALELKSQGYTRERSAEILNVSHCTVTHYILNRNKSERYKDVLRNYKTWINRGMRPLGVFKIQQNLSFDEKFNNFNLKKI